MLIWLIEWSNDIYLMKLSLKLYQSNLFILYSCNLDSTLVFLYLKTVSTKQYMLFASFSFIWSVCCCVILDKNQMLMGHLLKMMAELLQNQKV